jgi:hypothetical protein
LGIARRHDEARSAPLRHRQLYDEIALDQKASVGTAAHASRGDEPSAPSSRRDPMTTLTANTRASSTPALLSATSLLLAAAVALEIVGVRALAPADASAPAVVAAIDGIVAEAPAAPARRLRVASVEVHVVAQADLPAP